MKINPALIVLYLFLHIVAVGSVVPERVHGTIVNVN